MYRRQEKASAIKNIIRTMHLEEMKTFNNVLHIKVCQNFYNKGLKEDKFFGRL